MLLKLSKFFLYASLFAVVIVMPSTFFPFIGGKDVFFRIMTELALIFFMLYFAYEAHPGDMKKKFLSRASHPLFIAVSIFVISFLLASVFADDPHAAFWSNYERGEGGFQMLHYYLFFVLLTLLFDKWADWKKAFVVSIVAAGIMIGYGVLATVHYLHPQWFCTSASEMGEAPLCLNFVSPFRGEVSPDFTLLNLLFGTSRFQGSLGNPAYVAPYLMFSMFYAVFLWRTFVHGGMRAAETRKRRLVVGVLFSAIIAILLAFFVMSQTRGAFLGLGAGMVVALFYLILSVESGSRKGERVLAGCVSAALVAAAFIYVVPSGKDEVAFWTTIVLAVGLAATAIWGMATRRRIAAITLSVLVVLGSLGFFFSGSRFVQNMPGGRFFETSFSTQTAQTRFWTWNSAWQAFKDRPLFGWGPENFATAFDLYFDPRHFSPVTGGETWFDRAHSVFFDYLTETGVLGLIAYLGVFVVYFWEFWKRVVGSGARGEHETHIHLTPLHVMLLLALPVGYLVQGLILFDILPIYINLFFFLAFATFLFGSLPRAAENT